MIKKIIFFYPLFLFLLTPFCYAQKPIRLSKPRLELKDNNINIYYDILNSKEADQFRIWVEITDSTGRRINAQSLSGDIGKNVSGGSNKKITWDLTADSIYLDAGVYIQVNAEVLTLAEAEKPVRSISRGATIFQSLVFPGWGLSRINRGNPHWLKGLAGYGCIAASVFYNKKAVESYDDYLSSTDINKSETFYENSVKEDNLSETLAYVAVGIWVTDFIWTVAGSSKLKKNPNNRQATGFSIIPVYEYSVHAPMIAFRYNF